MSNTTFWRNRNLERIRFGAFGVAVLGMSSMSGCISDTDCGVCDPDKLVLESITGINYANRRVHLLTEGVDSGKYFIEDVGACIESTEANAVDGATPAARGPEEWCKLSPLVSWQGLEFVFNNLLDPTSVELVRKQPTNPNLFEVYDWKSQLAHIEGPITRYNGDYRPQDGEAPDTVSRSINLSCAQNLQALGMPFNHEVLDANPGICEGFQTVDGKQLPLKLEYAGKIESYRGETDWRANSCAAPDSGPDTCCTTCDYELAVNVAKYGVDGEGGSRRTPANALECDPDGNIYDECSGFVTDVNREFETNRYAYEWNGETGTFRLPLADKIRETHPDNRPAGVEPDGYPCQTDADCDSEFKLGSDSGASCVGETAEGIACDDDTAGCMNRHCKAEWFVTCRPDPNLDNQAYCVDKRYKDKGAGACFIATEDFQSCDPMTGSCSGEDAGNRLAKCDAGEFPDGTLSAEECCQPSLGATTPGASCDPLFLPNVTPVPRYDRDQTLPEETRDCFCGSPNGQRAECADQIEQYCTAPWGSLERADGSSNEGAYITRFVTKAGGVIYDPSLKGVLYLPSDRGNQPRSLVESCAETAQNPDLIGGRNVQDGWRMHDGNFFEKYENFDRGMCSSSEYKVVFASEGEHIVDKVGNELETLEYEFQTPEFHVVPNSGFPTDNLRIGACDDFAIRFSNRYDLDPRNLQKIELWQVKRVDGNDADGNPCTDSLAAECWTTDFKVAGGSTCTNDPDEVEASNGETVPCLIADVTSHLEGEIGVVIDSVRFGAQLNHFDAKDPDANLDEYGRAVTGRYRMVVPGLDGVASFDDLDLSNPSDLAAYQAAFHDVCGMPLITAGGQGYTDFIYDFTIDPPKCKEDPDIDGVQLSCDNARDYYNPDQEDQDLDEFGDISDLCILTPSMSNTADSDRDGIGNDCDICQEQPDKYNLDAVMTADPRMWVRNVPFQTDADQDGIGDVCDNCIAVANCGVFGPEADGKSPHSVGEPTPYEDTGVCQQDADSDMIGDACESVMGADDEVAGPVGIGNADDFDQDGINNMEDHCPRQPLEVATTCTADTDCGGEGYQCSVSTALDGTTRYCNHIDSDNDNVGDACDTCPFTPNPMQVTDGGMQLDDEDEDFVGGMCETNPDCAIRKDARPYGFYEVSVNGLCCVTTYPGDGEYVMNDDGSWDCVGLCDADGFPIRQDCPVDAVPGEDVPDGNKCRKLPSAVASLPGVLELAPGCQDALTTAGLCDPFTDPGCAFENANRPLTLGDVPDPDELWGKLCFLPQWDQDFDAIGDACDLCKFQFDPYNEAYVDPSTGKLYQDRGRFCFGDYAPDAICAAQDGEEDTTDTGTDTGTGTDSTGG
ncbi:thrombospondin type 3 repeat-containing protein [Nannocystaceae bacterium ST9]